MFIPATPPREQQGVLLCIVHSHSCEKRCNTCQYKDNMVTVPFVASDMRHVNTAALQGVIVDERLSDGGEREYLVQWADTELSSEDWIMEAAMAAEYPASVNAWKANSAIRNKRNVQPLETPATHEDPYEAWAGSPRHGQTGRSTSTTANRDKIQTSPSGEQPWRRESVTGAASPPSAVTVDDDDDDDAGPAGGNSTVNGVTLLQSMEPDARLWVEYVNKLLEVNSGLTSETRHILRQRRRFGRMLQDFLACQDLHGVDVLEVVEEAMLEQRNEDDGLERILKRVQLMRHECERRKEEEGARGKQQQSISPQGETREHHGDAGGCNGCEGNSVTAEAKLRADLESVKRDIERLRCKLELLSKRSAGRRRPSQKQPTSLSEHAASGD